MIDCDAKPRRNDPIYKWIGGRKPVITGLELCQSGDRMPDPALYWFDICSDRYLLKEVYKPVKADELLWARYPGFVITPEDAAAAARYPIQKTFV